MDEKELELEEKKEVQEEEIKTRPDYEKEIVAIIRSTTAPKVLKDKLDDYHEADIANSLEELSKLEREKLYRTLDVQSLSEIIEYADEDDQAKYFNEVNIKKAIAIINEMESDKAAELLREVDKDKRDIILELIEPDVRKNISLIFSYEEDEIGSKMTTNYIQIPRGITVKEAMRLVVAQASENDNISTIYVYDENNMYYGAVTLKDLIITKPTDPLEEIIVTSYPYLYANETIDHVVEELRDYNEDSIPIVNNDNILLGVITGQDLLEVLDEELSEDYAKLAGLAAEEDLEETLFQSLKKRLPWLLVLLALALLVSSVVSLFESVVAEVTIIMAFQALILGMAGNAGTQSLAVTIRVLMDDSLSGKDKARLAVKEAKVGFVNGLITGTLAFALLGLYIHFAKSYDWTNAYAISLCIGCSLWLAMFISSITGTLIPLFFKSIGIDPAVASGPLITTLNDLVGVITYYGLAWVFLIQFLHM